MHPGNENKHIIKHKAWHNRAFIYNACLLFLQKIICFFRPLPLWHAVRNEAYKNYLLETKVHQSQLLYRIMSLVLHHTSVSTFVYYRFTNCCPGHHNNIWNQLLRALTIPSLHKRQPTTLGTTSPLLFKNSAWVILITSLQNFLYVLS